MSTTAVPAARVPPRAVGEPLRLAFLGAPVWCDGCCPPAVTRDLLAATFELAPAVAADGAWTLEARARDALERLRPHVTVVFDPLAVAEELLRELPGASVGVLVAGVPADATAQLPGLDRLVSFEPRLTGTALGPHEIWRALPPPVADALYRPARPVHRAPRAMSIGRSTEHRETMLMPAKHHHDLLQVLHGLSGEPLAEVLGDCDVGVYCAPRPGGGFGHQVGMHLAAGQLLLSETLTPAHGLERNIDYLHIDSPDALSWVLERLGRFPEMHHRIRVRGRLKAEQYRASRVFARIAHDLLADVAAFGSPREAC
ncbi:MAG TPA: hypothetical protein VKV16_08475 [Solirubrobacteraceae bacterium]|nr:hypothetical protein [Solirubrobacteraceae bacterium]